MGKSAVKRLADFHATQKERRRAEQESKQTAAIPAIDAAIEVAERPDQAVPKLIAALQKAEKNKEVRR